MLRVLARVCAFAGCLGWLVVPLTAQEVVHALTGTVSLISNASKTITVFQDNGSQGVFQELSNPRKTPIEFDKKIAAGTTAANVFDKQGAYAIVFYVENADGRTVVALKSLGPGPFTSAVGTVEKFDRGHFITVKDNTGAAQTFKINAGTVVEGDLGVEEGMKFQAQTGDHVRVVGTTEGGSQTALFVRAM
jgi:hypothetical protein